MKLYIGADVVPTPKTEQSFIDEDGKKAFGAILEKVKDGDGFLINLECALTRSENAIRKFGPNLKADPRCADGLKSFGVTDVMLANNHVFDFGIEGLTDTMKNLERVGLPYTGVGENDTDSRKIYYIERAGKKVAIVNVCEHEYTYALPDRMGVNPYDPYLTMHDIREAKKNAEFVVVIYHGGKEHCDYPSPRLRLLAREMVENGANAVIAQHSHCIGCYEEFEGGHILYGQGNFHFCWNIDTDAWNTGLLVKLTMEQSVKMEFIPFVADGTGIDLAKGEKYTEIMAAFYDRNEQLKNGEWKDEWHAFCKNIESSYKNAANGIDNPDRFSHYLDCEAHTDVWRELFPTWNLTNEK
jgi:poly-gamma-glutamate synthesis protein (capsule biosynthesis protein)